MKKIQITAKTVQKAIEEGLKELNVTQDEVDIKILDEGGLFKKAKVELILDKADEEEKLEIKEDKIIDNLNNIEKNLSNEKLNNKTSEKDKKVDKENKNSNESLNKANNFDKKEDVKPLDEEKLEKNVVNVNEFADNNLSIKDAISYGTNFLKGLCERMNIEAEISVVEQEEQITFNASGDKVSNLIGKRGETLNAIQDILSNVLKNAGFRTFKVFFDVENYKNRREISLINLAERMAKKALKIEKPIKLERMNAYERKIIHTALQNFEGISTKSEGVEPNRYLVIIPNKEK